MEQTCYRHSNRETGVSCSNCGRPICPECMTSTPVGMRCPECAPGPSRVQRAAQRSGVRDDTPVVTYILMGICAVLFVGLVSSGMELTGRGIGTSRLAQDFALSGPLVAEGEPWRLITHSFLHRGIIHIALNMFILWQLGQMLEPSIGRLQFAVIYFVSVLCGALGVLLLEGGAVGASGGVFGLMAAAVVLMRSRGIDPMASGLPFWIGLNLVITFTIPGISVGGHLGGLVGGALAALVMFELPRAVRGLPRQAPTIAAAAIGVLAVAGCLAVA